MTDTGARGSHEEQEEEVHKRVRFNEELEVVEPDSADVDVALSGGAHGAAAQGDKRKRDIDDVGEKGMDIDKVAEVDTALDGGTDGDAVEGGDVTLGTMLSGMSRVDPEIENGL